MRKTKVSTLKLLQEEHISDVMLRCYIYLHLHLSVIRMIYKHLKMPSKMSFLIFLFKSSVFTVDLHYVHPGQTQAASRSFKADRLTKNKRS